MKITVLFNRVETLAFGRPDDILADEDSIETAEKITEELTRLGHDANMYEVNSESLREIGHLKTDVFFNQAFGVDSLPKTEAKIPDTLDQLGLSYTGSSGKAIRLTTNKAATKKLFLRHMLPTAKFQIFETGKEPINKDLKYPVIVKPMSEDCSLGISEKSVVERETQLRDLVRSIKETYSEPVLVEQYVDGRELNIAVIGNGAKATVLPISEIIFGNYFDNRYKVVDFSAKWQESSASYLSTPPVCPARLDQKAQKFIEEISLKAYRITGCRDYARVDIRLGKSGPVILEVNANPAIGPQDGVVNSVKAAGYTYGQFLKSLVSEAASRSDRRALARLEIPN